MKGLPAEFVADKDDNFDRWYKKMSIVPYAIKFEGEYLHKGNLMSSFNTTSSRYITITERVIYYHFNGKVELTNNLLMIGLVLYLLSSMKRFL